MARQLNKSFPIPLNINWHEGMLLSQHHFQQTDLRNFKVLAAQLKLLSSFHFGVRRLVTDSVALSDGIYRIKEIEAVFPDGLIFSYFPQNIKGLRPLEINIKKNMPQDSSEVIIFLAIAESSDNVSPILGNPARFYSVESEFVQDENIRENAIKIPELFPNGFLYIAEKLPDFCIGFPLCKIIRTEGVFHVKNWTPPCFFIEKHFPLWKRCMKLANSMREKATYLCEKLKNSHSGAVSFDTEKMLTQIITVLPGIEALIYSEEIRPYELYQELSEILGAVAVFIPTNLVPVMQPYDHNNIDLSMYTVIGLIEYYLSVIDRGFTLIQFNRKDKFFSYYLSSSITSQLNDNKIYIGVRKNNSADISSAEIWMNDAVIVSDSYLDTVRNKRVKGATRQLVIQDIVTRILPNAGIVLYEIFIDSNFIKTNENFHIFNPGSNEKIIPSEIILYLQRDPKCSNLIDQKTDEVYDS